MNEQVEIDRPRTAAESAALVAALPAHPRLSEIQARSSGGEPPRNGAPGPESEGGDPPHIGAPGRLLRNEIEALDEVARSFGPDFAHQRGDFAAVAEYFGIAAELGHVRNRLSALNVRVLNPAPAGSLSTAERQASFIVTIATVAGLENRTYTLDHLHTVFMEHCSAEHEPYWRANAGVIQGLLGSSDSSEEIRAELRTAGVHAWYSSRDRLIRIVNRQWLVSDEQQTAWVLGEGNGGWSCRCCGTAELNGLELIAVERRRLMGPGAKPQFTTDRVHEQCLADWTEMVGKVAGLSGQRIAVMPRGE